MVSPRPGWWWWLWRTGQQLGSARVLKMSQKTSVSSSAQSLRTWLSISSGPGVLLALVLLSDFLPKNSSTTWSSGGGEIFCAGALLSAFKASKEVIQLTRQRRRVVAGLRTGLLVGDGLDPMPQVPGISAVVEAVGDLPRVLSVGSVTGWPRPSQDPPCPQL